jgi:hypothetical protein
MSEGALLIVVIAAILAIASGWLVPILFKSRRPFGVLVTAVSSYVEWVWILPAIGFGKGWISVAAAIGDPLGFGWICLWLMRRIKA